MALKIAMIGAGSIGFTRRLMGDMLAVPEFADTTFAFTDINERNLDMVAQLAQRDITANQLPAKIPYTPDRRAAIAERLFDAMQRASRIGLAGESDDNDRGRFDAKVTIANDTQINWRAEPWAFEERNDDELNYDKYNKKSDRIYRVNNEVKWDLRRYSFKTWFINSRIPGCVRDARGGPNPGR